MPEPIPPSDLKDQLPWLVNGSLAPAERERLHAALEASPELRSERAFFEQLRETVRDDADQGPGQLGWHRLRRHIEQEQARQHSARAQRWWPRVAVAASVLWMVQAVWWWNASPGDGAYAPLSGASAPLAQGQVLLQVRFADGATQQQVSALLLPLRLQVVAGPSASGVYRLAVAPEQAVSALQTLRDATGVVETAERE